MVVYVPPTRSCDGEISLDFRSFGLPKRVATTIVGLDVKLEPSAAIAVRFGANLRTGQFVADSQQKDTGAGFYADGCQIPNLHM